MSTQGNRPTLYKHLPLRSDVIKIYYICTCFNRNQLFYYYYYWIVNNFMGLWKITYEYIVEKQKKKNCFPLDTRRT